MSMLCVYYEAENYTERMKYTAAIYNMVHRLHNNVIDSPPNADGPQVSLNPRYMCDL